MEDANRMERAAKIKEENRIRRGIILAVRNQAGAGFTYGGGSTSRSSAAGSDAGSRADVTKSARRESHDGITAREDVRLGSRVADDSSGADGGFFVTQQPGD